MKIRFRYFDKKKKTHKTKEIGEWMMLKAKKVWIQGSVVYIQTELDIEE